MNPFVKSQYDYRHTVTDPWNSELIWGNSSPVSAQVEATSRVFDEKPLCIFSRSSLAVDCSNIKNGQALLYQNGLSIQNDLTFDYSNRYNITPVSFMQRYTAQYGQGTAILNLDREPRFYASLADRGISRSWGQLWI